MIPPYVRPQFKREEYDSWWRIAKKCGYSGPWKLARVLFEIADENPALCRKRS